ncbi:hypothetical protein TNCT_296551, partial [Trichonephila clavata]
MNSQSLCNLAAAIPFFDPNSEACTLPMNCLDTYRLFMFYCKFRFLGKPGSHWVALALGTTLVFTFVVSLQFQRR